MGERVALECHHASTGKETLGVHLAPDGNNKDAFESLMTKAKTWHDNIRVGHLSPSLLAWQATTTSILKSLKYPLPALTLSYDECNKIMAVLKKGLLNSSRICTSTPKSILHGPIEDGGLKLNHLYHTQGIFHIKKFLKFMASDTMTGRLLQSSTWHSGSWYWTKHLLPKLQ